MNDQTPTWMYVLYIVSAQVLAIVYLPVLFFFCAYAVQFAKTKAFFRAMEEYKKEVKNG